MTLTALASAGTTVRGSARSRPRRSAALRGYLLVAPAMALVLLFFVWPLMSTFWMSLHDWPLFGAHEWVGLGNYQRLLTDTRFHGALRFTAYYTVVVTIAIFILAFALAFFVEKPRPLVGVYRTTFFLPVVIGLGASSLLWVWLANVDSGLFAPGLKALGLINKAPNLLANFDSAFALIIVSIVWKASGFTMIILLTGLQAIPQDIIEAAKVDGANAFKRFIFIVLPSIRRTLALALILSITGSVLAFDQFYIMTNGGPQNRMIGVVHYIFNQSFVSFKLGYGSALSIVLLLILVAISMVQLWLLRTKEDR